VFIGKARRNGRDSFGGKGRVKSREIRGWRTSRDILSRNRPAGVTSSESISRAFNIARATTEECRQAGRQALAVLSEGCREGRGEGRGAAAGIDNRTMGKIPVENVRDTDVAEGQKERPSRTRGHRRARNQTRLSRTKSDFRVASQPRRANELSG